MGNKKAMWEEVGKRGREKKRERAREGVSRFMLYIAQIIIKSSCNTPTRLLHPFSHFSLYSDLTGWLFTSSQCNVGKSFSPLHYEKK